MRRLAISIGAAALLATTLAPSVFAGDEWCSDDPVLRVQVDGRPATINVVVSVPVEAQAQLSHVSATAQVTGETVDVAVSGIQSQYRVVAYIRRDHLRAGDPDAVQAEGSTTHLVFRDVN